MTFSMMWVQGGAVIGVADSVVTRSGPGRSGTTALGQADEFNDRTVTEAVMKLSMIAGRVLVAMAGDQAAAVASVRALQAEVEAGAEGPAALDTISRRAKGDLPVEILVGSVVGGRPVLSEWYGRGRPVHHLDRVARIVGSLDAGVRSALRASALDTPGDVPPAIAITALQAAVHLAMALEPEMLRAGIGGALCGAAVDEAGVAAQPSTMWITADESFFDAMIAGDAGAGDRLGFIFTSVAENRHFVCSSYYEQPFSEAVFLAVPSPLSDRAANGWADAQRDEFFRPETVAFVSLRRKAVVVVPHASLQGSPVLFRRNPFGLAIDQAAARIFRQRLSEQRDHGVQITFHQWWQR